MTLIQEIVCKRHLQEVIGIKGRGVIFWDTIISFSFYYSLFYNTQHSYIFLLLYLPLLLTSLEVKSMDL